MSFKSFLSFGLRIAFFSPRAMTDEIAAPRPLVPQPAVIRSAGMDLEVPPVRSGTERQRKENLGERSEGHTEEAFSSQGTYTEVGTGDANG
jgi:hypothetical protein